MAQSSRGSEEVVCYIGVNFHFNFTILSLTPTRPEIRLPGLPNLVNLLVLYDNWSIVFEIKPSQDAIRIGPSLQ